MALQLPLWTNSIDDKKSFCKASQFGIPPGSILGPTIFNLYVADLRDITQLNMECVQYADDTTVYTHFNVNDF